MDFEERIARMAYMDMLESQGTREPDEQACNWNEEATEL